MPLETSTMRFRPRRPATGYLVVKHSTHGVHAFPSLDKDAAMRQLAAMCGQARGWSGGRFYHWITVERAISARIRFSSPADRIDLATWQAAGYEILRRVAPVKPSKGL